MEQTKRTPETAAEEVLHEFEEAELRLDDGEAREDDGEAADALSPSRPAQESARGRDGNTPGGS
ncbi:hypothetical protein LUX05_21290 [Streptomyces somaliensis]|uniref:Uncharacterized protein n=1 Tax=Streptomyces somaliensis (strain ATCC 33201 / DSM 40738 / JCM 12659 / KCTC 9044 / NCTC 11332 / NRRL B-12077 / IP 733) TaxID=1134445 RepID=A0AA44DGU9_STRE0|nr:hypothetical protein [Streptomyces somaliensis]MCP9963263.1 hypothetical protein [Streptomyces somaliensis]NKY16188.1 hypothetical protein [Streptomyces somaliensis DSM 40738]